MFNTKVSDCNLPCSCQIKNAFILQVEILGAFQLIMEFCLLTLHSWDTHNSMCAFEMLHIFEFILNPHGDEKKPPASRKRPVRLRFNYATVHLSPCLYHLRSSFALKMCKFHFPIHLEERFADLSQADLCVLQMSVIFFVSVITCQLF